MKKEYKKRPVIERFMRYIRISENGCWNWTGYIKRPYKPKKDLPYGHFSVESKPVRAHRWAYEYFIGRIPKDLELDHLCKNTICVNPKHLEPVTRKVNFERSDAISKINGMKTHCKRGHEFTPENTYKIKNKNRENPSRMCRTCQNALRRERNRIKKALSELRAPISP